MSFMVKTLLPLRKEFSTRKSRKDRKGREDMPKKFSALSSIVIGAAIEVHRTLGPGLLEKTYQQCLAHELKLNNVDFRLEHPLPVEYKGMSLDCGYRVDLMVADQIIVELKAVDQLIGIHEAQILTYMKLAGLDEGFLINFNVKKLKNGLKSFVF